MKALTPSENLIHQEALLRSATYKEAQADLLEIIMEVDSSKLFQKLNVNSTFAYCVQILKLSEAVTSNFINVGRKSVEVPELKTAIERGSLSLSKARKIVPILTKENAADWIARAEVLPQKKLEREVVESSPEKAPHFDRWQMVSGNQVQLQITVSEETAELLKRVQDLLCEKKQSHATNAESLEAALKFYLEKNDPVVKADRSKKSVVNVSRDTLKRRPLPRAVLHAVNRRDRRTCLECGSRRYLHIHHKKPISEGGEDLPENLMTLCGSCHRREHSH